MGRRGDILQGVAGYNGGDGSGRHLDPVSTSKKYTMKQSLRTGWRRRITVLAGMAGLFCAGSALGFAQNHANEKALANANPKALANSNVNGIGTAPVPETSTWVAMATLVAAAAYARHRRRTAQ
jgi:hypothetical protein